LNRNTISFLTSNKNAKIALSDTTLLPNKSNIIFIIFNRRKAAPDLK